MNPSLDPNTEVPGTGRVWVTTRPDAPRLSDGPSCVRLDSQGGFEEASCYDFESALGLARLLSDLLGSPRGAVALFSSGSASGCVATMPGRIAYHFDAVTSHHRSKRSALRRPAIMPWADDTGGLQAEGLGTVGRSELRERLDALQVRLTSDQLLPRVGADAQHAGLRRTPGCRQLFMA